MLNHSLQNKKPTFDLLVVHKGFNSKSEVDWTIPRGKRIKLLQASSTS